MTVFKHSSEYKNHMRRDVHGNIIIEKARLNLPQSLLMRNGVNKPALPPPPRKYHAATEENTLLLPLAVVTPGVWVHLGLYSYCAPGKL